MTSTQTSVSAPGATALRDLESRLRGDLIQPGDRDYEQARQIYNAMHDRRPALIVRAAGAADAGAAVRFAREHRLPLAVRGGGHGVAGFATCDDGLILDLGAMRAVAVDPKRRLARAGGGCTWGELNEATHAHGLATTGGVVSTTGIAGLTLGGGIGMLNRSCGLSCDNLVSAEVVTADGELVSCSESSNDDLFWALRGGGGNFGVATSFEYRLHPVAEVLGGVVMFPLERDVIRGFRDLMAGAPDGLGALLGLTLAPPAPFVPEEWHAKPIAAVIVCWSGATDEGEELLRPLADWAPVVARQVGPMPYPAINTLFDELLPPGLRHYWRARFVRDVPEKAIEIHLEHGARVPTVESGAFFFPMDGAVQRVAPDATAFAYRDSAFAVGIFGTWPDPADDEPNTAWVRDYSDALRPYSEATGYVNFLPRDDPEGAAAAYGRNERRLVEIKRRHDPENVFRLNQNVDPSA
jgi:FAD/FMN-containing dehydrogenase